MRRAGPASTCLLPHRTSHGVDDVRGLHSLGPPVGDATRAGRWDVGAESERGERPACLAVRMATRSGSGSSRGSAGDGNRGTPASPGNGALTVTGPPGRCPSPTTFWGDCTPASLQQRIGSAWPSMRSLPLERVGSINAIITPCTSFRPGLVQKNFIKSIL